MTEYEISLVGLAPPDVEKSVIGRPIPTYSHCVGTGKLLGALLGKSIAEECEISEVLVEHNLTHLSCMLRSYIVLDDFLKDSGAKIKNFPGVELWLSNIADRCIELISEFMPDPVNIWSRHIDIYRRAYYSFDFSQPFNSVIQKCNLIFLPFELEPVVSHSRCPRMLESMKNYLFALQLIDDFQDMEEDWQAPKNHNLFIAGLSRELVDVVMKGRSIFARALFTYIEQNMLSIQHNLTGPTVLSAIDHSLFWIREKKEMCQMFPVNDFFTGHFRGYHFNIANLQEAFLITSYAPIPNMEELRAENMHTLTTEVKPNI